MRNARLFGNLKGTDHLGVIMDPEETGYEVISWGWLLRKTFHKGIKFLDSLSDYLLLKDSALWS
jgi:hypothetical protein